MLRRGREFVAEEAVLSDGPRGNHLFNGVGGVICPTGGRGVTFFTLTFRHIHKKARSWILDYWDTGLGMGKGGGGGLGLMNDTKLPFGFHSRGVSKTVLVAFGPVHLLVHDGRVAMLEEEGGRRKTHRPGVIIPTYLHR